MSAIPKDLLKLVEEEEDFSKASMELLSLPNKGDELPPSFTIPTLLLGDKFTIVTERLQDLSHIHI